MNPVSGRAAKAARFIVLALLVPVLSHATLAHGEAATDDAPVFDEGVHERLIKRVDAGQGREYAAILESFEKHLLAHPGDVIAAVERCKFIEHFSAAEEPVVESASDDLTECIDGLKQGKLVEAVPVQLFLLQQEWGDAARKKGESLLAAAARWTPEQQAELYASLSSAYLQTGDAMKAGAFALNTVQLDPGSALRTRAADYLIRIGAKGAAVNTIEATPGDRWETYSLSSAVEKLISLDATDAARRLVEFNPKIELQPDARVLLARTLFAAGEKDAAHKLIQRAPAVGGAGAQYIGITTLRQMFELERDYGTLQSAYAAYRKLRDKGYGADALGHYRLSLSWHYPHAPWLAKDALGIGAFVLVIAAFAALPLLVVAPLHYRSVVKQLHGRLPQAPSPFAPWKLRHIWYALAVTQVAGVAALYFFDYPLLQRIVTTAVRSWRESALPSNDRYLGNAMLISTCVSLVALAPLLRGTHWRSLVLGEWSVKRSVFTGIGTAILLLALLASWRGLTRQAPAGVTFGTDTIRGMQAIHAAYGAGTLFLYAALLVPIVEEFVFRGVMLRTVSRYFALWVAVLVQAAAFMALHDDFSSYPFIFALALAAAWLSRTSGGLLAPLALHATNNAIAVGSLVTTSHLLAHLK